MSAKGGIDPFEIAARTVREVLDERADATPESIALIDPTGSREITYRDLQRQVRSVAAKLECEHVRPGEPVAYAMVNSVETVAAILGILYGGRIAVAINLVAGPATVAYVIEHSRVRLTLADQAGLEVLAAAQTGVLRPKTIRVDQTLFAQDGDVSSSPAEGATDGLIMYTSGTTGRPKGVVLSQGALLAGGANTTTAHALTAADRALCVLPLYHINGLCVTVMGPLVSGGCVVMPPRFSVSAFWDTVARFRCTWFSVVPTQISYLLHETEIPADADLASLRFGRSASAPLPPEVQQAFESKFQVPIVETMGLTETAAQILSNPLPPGLRMSGSPGLAVGNSVKIADDRQEEVPRGREGEVLVRGPNVMSRYLDNEEATNAALARDGWLRTGDLGRMDENGYVFITGRLKELIIKGGENIAPREIDEALYAHPDVVEAAAFACPCPRYGQRVEAGVVLAADSAATESELVDVCIRRLGTFRAPDRIHFLPELPKGPSGKVQRIRLQEMLAGPAVS